MRAAEQLMQGAASGERPVGTRLDFVDNLRWVMILMVVSIHAAVTYSHVGSWYYNAPPKPPITDVLPYLFYEMSVQAFFMGFLFFLAGYFVPGSMARKGMARFLQDRFVRLIVPALIYMLVVHPFMVYGLLRHENQIKESFGTAYTRYVFTGRFLSGSGPMWFTIALFVFTLGAVGWLGGRGSDSRIARDSLPRHWEVGGVILLITACTFGVRVFWPMGTNFYNMQFCFFSQYIVLFALGLIAAKRDWLRRISSRFGLSWFWAGLIGGSGLWLGTVPGMVRRGEVEQVVGGVTWQSAVVCFWESLFCVAICLGLIVLFREFLNFQGKFARLMTANSFGIYMFHAPVLVAITLVLQPMELPRAAKFLAATVFCTVLTLGLNEWIFRRTPLLKRVL